MAVELILLSDVQNLGRIGETIRVADGYARNYLVPKGLAAKASTGALRQLEAKKKRLQAQYEANIVSCQGVAEQIAANSVSIPVQAGEDEKLYGSVTAQQIVEALAEMNIAVDRKQVVMAEPIRELGVYNIEIHLHPEVTATVKVWVVKA